MPIIDPDQGVPLPDGTDLADNPAAFSNFYTPVLSRQNNRYVDEANRTALHPANINGEESYLTASGRKEVNTGAVWVSSYVRSLYANIRKGADQSNATAVLANDVTFVVPLPAAGTFTWEHMLFYDAATAEDIVFAYTWPAGVTGRWGSTALDISAAAGNGNVKVNTQTASGATLSFGGAGVATIITARLTGDITMGGTAGNLQFQFAQAVAGATNTTIRTRSRLEVWRVA
jgi:hypothetical protein